MNIQFGAGQSGGLKSTCEVAVAIKRYENDTRRNERKLLTRATDLLQITGVLPKW